MFVIVFCFFSYFCKLCVLYLLPSGEIKIYIYIYIMKLLLETGLTKKISNQNLKVLNHVFSQYITAHYN